MSVQSNYWEPQLFTPPPIEEGQYGLYEKEADIPNIYQTLQELTEAVHRLNSEIIFISDAGDGQFRLYGNKPEEMEAIFKAGRKKIIKSLYSPTVVTILGALYLLFVLDSIGSGGSLFLIMVAIYGINPFISAYFNYRSLLAFKKSPHKVRVDEHRLRLWMDQKSPNISWILPAILVISFAYQFDRGMETVVTQLGLVKPITESSQYYRLLTVALVHGSFLHVIFNAGALYTLNQLCLKFASMGLLLIVFLVSVVSGSLFSLITLPEITSVGASGGILGLLGFPLALALKYKKLVPMRFAKNLLEWLALIAAFGLMGYDFIDNGAHLGGALAGFLIGLLYPEAYLLKRIEKISAAEDERLANEDLESQHVANEQPNGKE